MERSHEPVRARCSPRLIVADRGDTVLTAAFKREWDAPHRVLGSCVKAAEGADHDVAIWSTPSGEFPIGRFSTIPPTKDMRGNIEAMRLAAGTSVSEVRGRATAADIVAELISRL